MNLNFFPVEGNAVSVVQS